MESTPRLSPPWRTFAAGVLGTIGLPLAAVLLLHAPSARGRAEAEWKGRLTALAEDRRAGLDAQLGAAVRDAETIAGFPTVAHLLGQVPSRPGGSGVGDAQHLIELLENEIRAREYIAAWVLDRAGRPVARTRRADALDSMTMREALAGVAPGRPAVLVGQRNGRITLFFAAPVRRGPRQSGLGVVVLAVDPAASLYPMLEHPPFPSTTAETFLVQARGDSV